MRKILACLALALLPLSNAVADIECQNFCTNEEVDCNTECIPGKGPGGVLSCATKCSKKAAACVKKTCKTKDKTSVADMFAVGRFQPAPIDWEGLAGPKPKPRPVCDCKNPGTGGCERHLCIQPNPASEMSSLFKADPRLMPNTCGFCRGNPGLGLCKAAKSCYTIEPIIGADDFKKRLKIEDFTDAQIDLGRASLLSKYLKDSGVVTNPEYKDFLQSINTDSSALRMDYKNYLKTAK